MIFAISKDDSKEANPLTETSFEDSDIKEVGEGGIEEWILKNPNMLEEKLLVVCNQFSAFENSQKRVDVLAIDKNGKLVVVEIKRTKDAGDADIQALRYAAMVATMTVEELLTQYTNYRKNNGNKTQTPDESRKEIIDFISVELSESFSDKPRIILCSKGFSTEITTTALYLQNEYGMAIKCVEIKPYKTDDGNIFINSKTIIPLKKAEDYMTKIKIKEEAKERESKRKENINFPMLGIEIGEKLTFKDDESITCIVSSYDKVKSGDKEKYGDKEIKISKLADLIREQRGEGVGVSGSLFWKYEGETLFKRRERMEASD